MSKQGYELEEIDFAIVAPFQRQEVVAFDSVTFGDELASFVRSCPLPLWLSIVADRLTETHKHNRYFEGGITQGDIFS